MSFFESKPNLSDAEKARIEFHLQQVAECIGFERFERPVVPLKKLEELRQSPLEQTVAFVGEHLSHDTQGLQVKVTPEKLEKCGGGG